MGKRIIVWILKGIAALGIIFTISLGYVAFVIHPADENAAEYLVDTIKTGINNILPHPKDPKQDETENQGLNMEDVVAMLKNGQYTEETWYDPNCIIAVDNGNYRANLPPSNVFRGLTTKFWSGYDTKKLANCKTITVNDTQYLVIHGDTYEIGKNIEVVKYK